MNETLKIIQTRRSTRKFLTDDLPENAIDAIIEAGQYAPSAKNEQAWHFTVIKSRSLLNLLNEACKSFFLSTNNELFQQRLNGSDVKSFDLFYHAPVLIAVSGDAKAQEPLIDCSMAIENMLLAAESLEIGSCWVHAITYLSRTTEGKELLIRENILPAGYELAGTCAFGYKAEEPKNPLPRKTDTVTWLND